MAIPKLSVVVASGAAAGDREACLAALAGQQFPRDEFEVIETVIEGDLGRAWNLGATRARGHVLLFLRDDVVPSPTLVAEHLRLWRERPRDLVTGPTQLDPRAEALSRCYGEHAGTESSVAECCGRTLAMGRDLFVESGGFATGLDWGTEAELVFRMFRRGAALARLACPVGVRRMPGTFKDIATLLDAEGRASVALYRRHPGLLPFLKLGAFSTAGEAALTLRRALLGLGSPVTSLGLIGAILPAGARRESWYRFLCAYLYWRGVRLALADREVWRRLSRGPVILMYHAVGIRGEEPGCYIVPAKRFARQMRWLKLTRYNVLSLDELLRYRREYRLPPARSVAITFDDGYRDNGTLATPTLQRLGLTATFFLVTGRLGATNDWDRDGELAARPLLSWADVRQLLGAGMTVGAHTRTHPTLPALSPDEAIREIEGAHLDLTRELGVTSRTFAYPFGRFDASTSRAVERAGYSGACCSRSGVNDPAVSSFLLRRLEVRGTDSLFRFALAVRRGRARRKRSAS